MRVCVCVCVCVCVAAMSHQEIEEGVSILLSV